MISCSLILKSIMEKAFKLKLELMTNDDVVHFGQWVLHEKKLKLGKFSEFLKTIVNTNSDRL